MVIVKVILMENNLDLLKLMVKLMEIDLETSLDCNLVTVMETKIKKYLDLNLVILKLMGFLMETVKDLYSVKGLG